jgi:hypothetical protein
MKHNISKRSYTPLHGGMSTGSAGAPKGSDMDADDAPKGGKKAPKSNQTAGNSKPTK